MRRSCYAGLSIKKIVDILLHCYSNINVTRLGLDDEPYW